MKKLLAAAVAAAFVPVAAAADTNNVTIYGKLHVSYDYTKVKFKSPGADRNDDPPPSLQSNFKQWNFNSGPGTRDSRIGIKGTEDLGNGLKAIWKYEVGVDLTDLSGTFSNRNAYIGLAGDWGTLLAGQHDTPYKISRGKLDYFADTIADFNNTVGFDDVRAPDVLAYISPSWSGFTVAAAGHSSERRDKSTLVDGYSIAGIYNNNGLYASLAYEDLKKANTGTNEGKDQRFDKNKKWQVGLGYEMNGFGLAGVYEDHKVDPTGSLETEFKRYTIQGKYGFGNNTLKAMYGHQKADPDGGSTLKSDSWAIGWDYALSKRTEAYVVYGKADEGVTLRTETRAVGPDDGMDGLSIGMIHTF